MAYWSQSSSDIIHSANCCYFQLLSWKYLLILAAEKQKHTVDR